MKSFKGSDQDLSGLILKTKMFDRILLHRKNDFNVFDLFEAE
jgi:hypothetical protein